MLMRPPSREDVRTAQNHLVLLKTKIQQRRLRRVPPGDIGGAEHFFNPDPRLRNGRFERVAAGDAMMGGAASQAPPRGLGSRGVAETPPRGGMTWDPPAAPYDEATSSSRGSTGRMVSGDDTCGYPSAVNAGPPVMNSPVARISPAAGARSPAHAALRESPWSGSGSLPPGLMAVAGSGDDGGPRVSCPDCGRKFNEDCIDTHIRICKKVFQQKRKRFDSAANRLGDLENAPALIANAQRLNQDKDKVGGGGGGDASKGVPKWRQKSMAFRQAILAARAATGDAEAQVKADELQHEIDGAVGAGGMVDPDMVRCPHCGRTFNKEAGERHIAICLRTFGGRPGGGRLVKGGGHYAVSGAGPKAAPAPAPAAAGGGFSGSAASNRRPSAHRNRSSPQQGGGGGGGGPLQQQPAPAYGGGFSGYPAHGGYRAAPGGLHR